MSLASIIHYGEGFEQAQEDMLNKRICLCEAKLQIVSESKIKTEITNAHWDGYVDGINAYLVGEIL